MANNNVYRDISASLLRFASDFAAAQTNMTVVNMDAYASPTEWPQGDFVGLAEKQLDVDESFVTASLAFVISTKGDKNLFRMDALIDELLDQLLPTRGMLILDALTGVTRGRLIVSNQTRVGPVIHTESQPARPIMVTLRSDKTLKLTV